jgi:hypothetical protein
MDVRCLGLLAMFGGAQGVADDGEEGEAEREQRREDDQSDPVAGIVEEIAKTQRTTFRRFETPPVLLRLIG